MISSTKNSDHWLLGKKFIKEKVIQNLSLNILVVPTAPIIANGDSGASKHCFSTNTTHLFTNHKNELGPPIIGLPDWYSYPFILVVCRKIHFCVAWYI